MRRITSLAGFALLGCGAAPQEFTAPLVLGGREIAPERLNEGHRLYRNYCASCHGLDGRGGGPAAQQLRVAPRDFSSAELTRKSTPGAALPTHEDLREAIRAGAPERGMPGWEGLRTEDLDALADYVKTFSPRWRE